MTTEEAVDLAWKLIEPALDAKLEEYRQAGFRQGVEAAAKVADKWEAQYPPDIWPEDGTSIDAKAAKHGRHVARMAAQDIRALVPAAPAEKSHTVCIGKTTIDRLAREGAIWFDEPGVGLVAADDLFTGQPAAPAERCSKCGHDAFDANGDGSRRWCESCGYPAAPAREVYPTCTVCGCSTFAHEDGCPVVDPPADGSASLGEPAKEEK